MPVPAGAPPTGGVCTPWVSATEVQARPDMAGVTVPAGDVETACLVASGILFDLSGRQFPGACTSTVRPYNGAYGCRHRYHQDTWAVVDSMTAAVNGMWRCDDGGLDLGLYPVRDVVEVKVGGVVLDPSGYRVDGQRWLVRPGLVWWPPNQRLDLDDTEVGTFAVTAVHGADPPPAGVWAASTFAAELAKSHAGLPNGLPRRLTSITRQGVSIGYVDPMAYLDKGRTGIPEVDGFLVAVNPARQRVRPAVFSPDLPRRRRT